MSDVSDVSDREAAIRERIEPYKGTDVWSMYGYADVEWLLAELAAARERLAHEQLRTQHEVQRWQEAEAREAKLREALEADPSKWSFDALVLIARLMLETNYPPDIFTGESGEPGPVFVARLREALAALGET